MIQKFQFEDTQLEGVKLIHTFCAEDNRGCLIKDYSEEIFRGQGISHELKEVFYTVSQKGVIRALHFQREFPQAKLVRCVAGSIYDVVVNLRRNSDQFGNWQGFYLSGDSKTELLIPGDYAHGYLVLEPSVVSYKCNEKFYGEYDDGIYYLDPDLHITWPLDQTTQVILAEKDKVLQSFSQFKERYGGL